MGERRRQTAKAARRAAFSYLGSPVSRERAPNSRTSVPACRHAAPLCPCGAAVPTRLPRFAQRAIATPMARPPRASSSTCSTSLASRRAGLRSAPASPTSSRQPTASPHPSRPNGLPHIRHALSSSPSPSAPHGLPHVEQAAITVAMRYGGTCKRIYVARPPAIFTWGWRLIEPFLLEETRAKVSVVSPRGVAPSYEHYGSDPLTAMRPESLPVSLGGTRTEPAGPMHYCRNPKNGVRAR